MKDPGEGRSKGQAWRSVAGLGLALLSVIAVVLQTLDTHRATRLEDMQPFRRFWSDMTLAITSYLDYRQPAADIPAGDPEPAFRAVLLDRQEIRDLNIARPFETLRPRAFLPFRQKIDPGQHDDPGRARLLAWSFRLVGGISPYMLFWLATAFFVPAAGFAFIALARSRLWPVAFVLLAWLCLWPFVAETLAMPRNPVGFYLVGVITLIGSTIRSVFGPPERLWPLVIRATLTGAFLAILISCRSSVVFCLPGFLAGFLVAARRRPETEPAGALRRFTLALALLLIPIAASRDGRHHDVWLALWEGLGDFDRAYDHTWSDPVAEAYVKARGAPSLRSEATERILREVVLSRIVEHPLWFAEILVKRAASTITLWKLWPYGPTDGEFIRRSTSANEGAIDKYFTYATTVDFVGWSSSLVELRAFLLIGPLFLYLVGIAIFRGWDRRGALALACMAAGVLGLPVLMTTAGGQETQCAFALHVLGAGFLLREAVAAVRRP